MNESDFMDALAAIQSDTIVRLLELCQQNKIPLESAYKACGNVIVGTGFLIHERGADEQAAEKGK